MGFMDKLKDAGSKALKGAVAMASTSYGLVSTGKHANCKVAMTPEHDTIVFIKIATEEARYNIREDIKFFEYTGAIQNSHTISVVYNNDETSNILLSPDNQKTTLEEQYANMAVLLMALSGRLTTTDETKSWVNLIMRYAGRKPMF